MLLCASSASETKDGSPDGVTTELSAFIVQPHGSRKRPTFGGGGEDARCGEAECHRGELSALLEII